MAELTLNFGLIFEDLYTAEGIRKIDRHFIEFVRAVDTALAEQLEGARRSPESLTDKGHSDLLMALAPFVDDFIGSLFGIGAEIRAAATEHQALAPLFTCKRLFVQRQAVKKYKAEEAQSFDGPALETQLSRHLGENFDEMAFAQKAMAWLEAPDQAPDALDAALRYAAWAVHSPAGQAKWQSGVVFHTPHKIDPLNLVPLAQEEDHGTVLLHTDCDHVRRRKGFELTDPGMDLTHSLDQANYCIWCHNQGKDSCAKGLTDRKTGEFRESPFGSPLTGCPLEEKISEMNLAKSEGHLVGALALVTVDNPLCAATGHRICNDCMKACIYQKQEPVDIPQVESKTLKDVLGLPWGFEIYSLLTRWGPLDLHRPVPKDSSGYKVLVVGLGPAGFNLAHHLMNDGHSVVGVDGLKIEPLPSHISGVGIDGQRHSFEPIERIETLQEALDERALAGFGGVAEYGITVRWDKNNLKIIRLLLERRQSFAMFGGIRFGGTITVDDAWKMGFDHIALCVGAGRPTFISMPNSLAKGVRMASDFLMALQLTGAAKKDSIANLQLRLPAVVIGGGLTAVDAATEALAYYCHQVEKFLSRYENLQTLSKGDDLMADMTAEEKLTAQEFLDHGRAIRAERQAADQAGREPKILELLNAWGGVTLAYRRRMVDSPSYTGNHEELAKAMEEGIRFAECLTPRAVEIDEFGHAKALRLERFAIGEEGRLSPTGEEVVLPAKAILVAAGTQPNTVLGREDPKNIPPLDGKYFQAFSESGEAVHPQAIAKPETADVFMASFDENRRMSFWGDLHPSFAGNVVKAMGGTKQGYPAVTRSLARQTPSPITGPELIAKLNRAMRPKIREVVRLTPEIVELITA